jgi:hypothetical protein
MWTIMSVSLSLSALQPTTYRKCSKEGAGAGRLRTKNQGQHGTRPGVVRAGHQKQTRGRSRACVRVHVHGASRARDSGRLVSRRLVATVSSSAWQPRQPSYTFFNLLKKIESRGTRKRHIPFELASFLIRFIRDGALEDRA